MGLRDLESSLPPGFRFYPSDEELVCHYLYKKVSNERVSEGTMVEVDLHTREPWELPDVAKLSANEWYFFSFRDRKYSSGSRTNRATKSGYWKATGKDRTIYNPSSREIVGMRKTLVFYRGRAPNGIKSGWVMHEFRLENPHTPPKEDWVLCRVFHKKKGEEENNSMTSYLSSSLESSHLVMVDQPLQGGNYMSMNTAFNPSAPQHEDHNSANSLLNVANLLQSNFLDFPQEGESMPSMMELGARDGEEFGFLLDVGLGEEHGMIDGGFGNLGDFRFQGAKGNLYY